MVFFSVPVTLLEFLQGVSIACYAEPCISSVELSVHLSVYLSVIRLQCVKTTPARITKSLPTDSPRTQVLALKSSSRNSKARALNESGVGKIRYFQPINRRIS